MNTILKHLVITGLALFSSAGFSADPLAGTCPELPNLLRANVSVKTSYDASTKLYRYEYRVSNKGSSKQDLRLFALDLDRNGTTFEKTPGWIAGFIDDTNSLTWFAGIADEDNPGRGVMPRTKNQLKPGTGSVTFVVTSPLKPGVVSYRIAGWEQSPSTNPNVYSKLVSEIGKEDASELWQEEIMGQCPLANAPMLDRGVLSTTVGPSAALPVKITKLTKLLPGTANEGLWVINGSQDVDVRSISTQSLSVSGIVSTINNLLSFKDLNLDGFQDLVIAIDQTKADFKNCAVESILAVGDLSNGTKVSGSIETGTNQCEFVARTFDLVIED